VIAEDMVLLRDGLAQLFTVGGDEVVAAVGDARSLIHAVLTDQPDLAIVDIRMPPTHTDEGARAVREIRHRASGTATLVLSNVIEPTLVSQLMRAGTRGFGYLLKESVLDVASFRTQAHAVAAGGTVIDPQVVATMMRRNEVASGLAALSRREHEVLALIAGGSGNRQIAAQLYLSEKTIDSHIRTIFGKLNLPDTPEHHRRVLAVLTWLGLR